MRVLNLEGTHYEMGRRQGELSAPWRSLLLRRIHHRLENLPAHPLLDVWYGEVIALLEREAPAFLQYAEGQADGLGMDCNLLLRFSLASYLEDMAKDAVGAAVGSCTTWAAGSSWTQNGQPILAKNRDQRIDQLELQWVVYARPADGFRYFGVTTLGWPGLASSGINVAGLAVADTHVPSKDLGPGLPRWWLMVSILEQCQSVGEALDYLVTVPRLGNGILVLADASGGIAAFEEGHAHFGIRTPTDGAGYVVATNHFVTNALRDMCRLENLGKKGDSIARKARMEAALAEAKGQVSVSWARVMMSSVDGIGAPCWLDTERNVGTISTAILSPAKRMAWVRHGRVWHGRFQRFALT